MSAEDLLNQGADKWRSPVPMRGFLRSGSGTTEGGTLKARGTSWTVSRDGAVVAYARPLIWGLYFWRRRRRWGLTFKESRATDAVLAEIGTAEGAIPGVER